MNKKQLILAGIVALLIMLVSVYGYSSWNGYTAKELLGDCLAQPGEDEDSCYAQKGIELASLELCDEIGSLSTQGFCYNGVAQKLADLSVCELITEGFWSSVCYGHFALEYNDELLCLKTGTIGERDRCLRSVGNATKNSDTCLIIGMENIRDDCLWDVATQGVIEDCSTVIEDGIDKALCKMFFAVEEQSYDLCGQIKTDRIRKDCRFRVQRAIENDLKEEAVAQNDPTLCNQINIVSIKRACEEETSALNS